MKYLFKIFFFTIGIPALFFAVSCINISGFKKDSKIICSAEKVTSDKKHFISDNNSQYLFGGGITQTGAEAHSGKFSAMASKKHPYVMAFTIKHTGPDMFFKVSVWRKSKNNSTDKGGLVISDITAKRLYHIVNSPALIEKNGWEKLELGFFTPPNFVNEDVKIYCWDISGDSIYFDDMKIIHTQKKYPVYKEDPLSIVLDTSDYRKLINKRIDAFNAGVLQTGNSDWVKGMVFGDGKMMKAKLRLKGDWLDHLVGDKWSFRIKMRKNYSWKSLRVFSIQTPFARNFLYEWFAHKLYESKDILTTRYGFVPVIIGSRSKGLYAWEEHFTKQLVESRNRREGPILKFSENGFWQIQRIAKVTGKWTDFPFYYASVIEPFSESKTLKNPVLFREFGIAQILMRQYKNVRAKPDAVFDIRKLAKYYAMLDITHARHGMAWHNQRYYYNPILCKLEPIAYDGYTDNENIDFSLKDNIAYKLFTEHNIDLYYYNYYYLFEDTNFLTLYIKYLEEFSSKSYVDSISKVLAIQVDKYDSLINKEFPLIHFDKQFLAKSTMAVRNYLPKLKSFISNKIDSGKLKVQSFRENNSDSVMFDNTVTFFVTAYKEQNFGDSILISIHNFFGRKIILLGTGIKKKFIQNYFSDRVVIAPYKKGDSGVTTRVTSETGVQYLFFKVNGFDRLFSVKINPWPYPKGITPQQELMKTVDLANCPAIDTIIGNKIYIKPGLIKIEKPLVIPKGFKVLFNSGTRLDLVKHAMFLSYSPVYLRGTQNKPVVIMSSDKTGNGFTVLQAESRSIFNYVRFENLNTLNYKGWTLTGAVTFYESKVSIDNTLFLNNVCEDALNIVRSDFTLRNSKFSGTWGDGFDSDFSTGLVDSVSFTDIGNDAIDFSGSRIEIANSIINKVQDKGVSGGEDSHLTVRNTIISGANIGLASKDLSSLKVSDSRVENCKYGVVLLQKKPEYGPATMNLQNVKIINAETKMLIEKGSKVIFNRKIINGDKKKVAKLFY